MKKFFAIAFVLVFHTIHAQPSSVLEVMKFYPLNNGDYWEYGRFMNDNYVDYPVEPHYWLKVMGDTVFSNGITYKKIQRGSFSGNSNSWMFERIDSTTSSVYRVFNAIEYKIDSLLANPGDRIACARFTIPFVWFSKCLSEGEETFFNQKFIVKTMRDFTSSMGYKYKLMKGIGYCYSESMELTFQGEKLLYAIINGVEYGIKTDIVKHDEIPTQFFLSQNYPNPFNPGTTIKYSIPLETGHAPSLQHVSLKVYDILGREIASLVNDEKPAGNYEVKFDASFLTSGIYFYQLQSGNFSETKKLVLLK